MCMEMSLDVCQQIWLFAVLKSFFWVASGLLGKVKTVNAPTVQPILTHLTPHLPMLIFFGPPQAPCDCAN